MSVRLWFWLLSASSGVLVEGIARTTYAPIRWAYLVWVPVVLIGVYDQLQRRHSLLRNYPVIGHGRYLLESIRPELQQYFVESNTDGTPFDRERRSLVYQRAKRAKDTVPFGTQLDVYAEGYEWMEHSIAAQHAHDRSPRCVIGETHAAHPYSASLLNISAMSFGSLSARAIRALSSAARLGNFAHNTGEGAVSDHHLAGGGDLIWQIGTGYFGCRTTAGAFDPSMFRDRAAHPQVKMVEIKLSQGAKPGHGGILPAAKVTSEIARIRGVSMGEDVLSPPGHTAFSTPIGLLEFVAQLRAQSDGKPVGFKLCVGQREEFLAICKAMIETGIQPDFITVDGGEGGTGAAPLEFSNRMGAPLLDGLSFVHHALRGAGLREGIRLGASGKISTGFDMARVLSLGADFCYAARAMMFALGCIQARRCNSNDCPVGVATQDQALARGLHVDSKAQRVAHFHEQTLAAFAELIAAAGLEHHTELLPGHLHRRTSMTQTASFASLYPGVPVGALCDDVASLPPPWRDAWARASAATFRC